LHGQYVVRLAQSQGVMPWGCHLDGTKGSACRLFPIAQITRHLTSQESITPSQLRVVQPLHTVLLLAQTMLRLLIASQSSQGKRQSQVQVEEQPLTRALGWQPFAMGKGTL